jgi:hypothetical protein
MTEVVDDAGGHSSITTAEIHHELDLVRQALLDLSARVERLSGLVAQQTGIQPGPIPSESPTAWDAAVPASVPPGPTSPAPTTAPAPSGAATPPGTPVPAVAPNPVDAILGETFGRPS